MLLFFIMCYDKIFDTSGGIMRKKLGVNEWIEYLYSYSRSRPVTDFTRKSVCGLGVNALPLELHKFSDEGTV